MHIGRFLLPNILGSYSYFLPNCLPPNFLGWGPWASSRSAAGRMWDPRGKLCPSFSWYGYDTTLPGGLSLERLAKLYLAVWEPTRFQVFLLGTGLGAALL